MSSRPKSGGTTGRRTTTRNRKPATIDLEAKNVEDSATSSSNSTGSKTTETKSSTVPDTKTTQKTKAEQSASKDVPEQKLGRDAAKNNSEKPASANKKEIPPKKPADTAQPKNKSGGGFLSALMGGVAAVVGLGAIGQVENAGEIPFIGKLYSGGQSETPQIAANELQSLRDQIKGLSGSTVDLSPVTSRLDTLEQNLADLPNETSNVADAETNERIAALEAKIGAVENTPNTGNPEAFASLETSVAELAQRLEVMEASGTSNDATDTINTLDTRLAALEEAIGSLREEIATNTSNVDKLASQSGTLEETVASVKASEKVARSVAVNALGTALENDDPLALPIASLQALVGETPETQRLAALSEAGIPSLKVLVSELDAFSAGLQNPDAPKEDASLSDRFWANAQKLVSFRSTGPRAGDDPFAILSRVRANVKSGELGAAIAEWEKLPQAIKDEGGDWATKLGARNEAQTLYQKISQLLADSAS